MSGQFQASQLIAGPAVVRFGATGANRDVITEGDITEKIVRETWVLSTSLHGQMDTRLKSQHVELSFTPAGDSIGFGFCATPGYGPADIGKSIMNESVLAIATVGGQTITYNRWALTKPATIRLGASVAMLGDCTVACLHKNNTSLADSASLNTVASAAFSSVNTTAHDAPSRRWQAAFGATTMHVEGPIEISIEPEIEIKKVESFGAVSIMLKSLSVKAKFKPATLTEAQYYALMAVQGASAILPGQSLAKASNSLVITELADATPKTATIFAAGIDTGGLAYGDVTNRNGELTFISRARFTGAAPQALWAFNLF